MKIIIIFIITFVYSIESINYQDLDEDLKNDIDVFMKYFDINPFHAFKYAGDKIKNDRKIVLMAVKKDGSLLQYAKEEFRNDIEIASEAIKSRPSSFEYLSEFLRDNSSLLILALKGEHQLALEGGWLHGDWRQSIIKYASERLKIIMPVLLGIRN